MYTINKLERIRRYEITLEGDPVADKLPEPMKARIMLNEGITCAPMYCSSRVYLARVRA